MTPDRDLKITLTDFRSLRSKLKSNSQMFRFNLSWEVEIGREKFGARHEGCLFTTKDKGEFDWSLPKTSMGGRGTYITGWPTQDLYFRVLRALEATEYGESLRTSCTVTDETKAIPALAEVLA
jgi:hypothetical protein